MASSLDTSIEVGLFLREHNLQLRFIFCNQHFIFIVVYLESHCLIHVNVNIQTYFEVSKRHIVSISSFCVSIL